MDTLVNNAGLQRDVAFEEMTLEQWQKVIGVNLTGQFLCAREAVRAFKRQGVRPEVSCAAGKIVCISSVHDLIPWAGRVNYAASKGGVMLDEIDRAGGGAAPDPGQRRQPRRDPLRRPRHDALPGLRRGRLRARRAARHSLP